MKSVGYTKFLPPEELKRKPTSLEHWSSFAFMRLHLSIVIPITRQPTICFQKSVKIFQIQ